METLVATVLIMVIFMGASMVLNNLFVTGIAQDDHAIRQHLYALQYQVKHEKIDLPYIEDFGAWEVSIDRQREAGMQERVYRAVHATTQKELVIKERDVR